MSWLKLSWKNMTHRPLGSFLSILLLAFGTGIIALLMSASKQIEDQFTKNIKGIDMVVGAKGSPLQLILSSVYHIDAPTGNIPFDEYQKLLKNPLVKGGIPLSYGDNYEGYRIVGTTETYLDQYEAEISSGKIWAQNGEVVIGSKVAELLGLKIGDSFNGNHGLQVEAEAHDHFAYRVTGILKPTGAVIDKLILSNLESVWAVHEEEHDHEEGHDHGPREITAALIKFRSPMGNLTIPRMVNQRTSMQAALPAIEINRLFALMGSGIKTLRTLAYLIVIISAISVFISLYQSLKDRKYELALLRSLGASRLQLFLVVIFEGLIISLLGYICGLILGKLGLYAISSYADASYNYNLEIAILTYNELILLLVILAVGFLAAFLPSLQAFRLNISKTLSDA